MRHQDLTINHRLESWVYADAAARTGATGFVAGDVGRIAYQTDTGEYWRLISTTPTWQRLPVMLIGGTTNQVLAKNSATNYDASWKATPPPSYPLFQSGNLAPGGTTSTSGVMAGLGSAAGIAPQLTGRLLVAISGSMQNNTANMGVQVQLRWGTGTAPAGGAAPTGNAFGPVQRAYLPLAGGFEPLCIVAIITGLPLGTPIWLDVTQAALGGGTANVSGVAIAVHEF